MRNNGTNRAAGRNLESLPAARLLLALAVSWPRNWAVSKSTMQRILAETKLRPHRLESYMASNDTEFENKAADIIGLYWNPPQRAALFCVGEKTAIPAVDRLDPVLPSRREGVNATDLKYYRHHAAAERSVECEDRHGGRKHRRRHTSGGLSDS